eukprot:247061_1
MTEIGHLNGKDLARDTRGTKSISFFLKNLASKCPKLVLNKISLVVNHLNEESYVMRNGIITMIGSLIENIEFNNDQNKKIKNDLFDMLETRILDINSYTRSKVLQVWAHLMEEKIVPVYRLCNTLIPIIKNRLNDKSALVRKQSINVLSIIIKNNPWGPLELDNNYAKQQMNLLKNKINIIENKLTKIQLKLSHKLLKKAGVHYNDDQQQEEQEEDQNEDEQMDLEQSEQEEEEEEEIASFEEFDELKIQRKQLMMLELFVLFTGLMSECAIQMSQLLSSKTQTDVLECIRFFKIACTFKISNEKLGFERMLPLVWNKDNNQIIFNVLKAYHYKYIQSEQNNNNNNNNDDDNDDNDDSAMKIAINLITLTNGATLADIT